MFEELRATLEQDPRIQYALVFGSRAQGRGRPDSDLDVAIGLSQPLTVHELGDLISRLESATGLVVDLVLLDEASPALAYRVFRDGVPAFVRDERARADRWARAVLEYFDWKPTEEILTQGVLAAARRGRQG